MRRNEQAIQRWLCDPINEAKVGEDGLGRVRIENARETGVASLDDLVCRHDFTLIEDQNPGWKLDRSWLELCGGREPPWLNDVSGGTTVDIVLRSGLSGENRILIEVKDLGGEIHGHPDCHQVLRYLLHLLVTTREHTRCDCKRAPCSHDVRRAVLLAAPPAWFAAPQSKRWSEFVDRYRPLARVFDITLGEIHTDQIGATEAR